MRYYAATTQIAWYGRSGLLSVSLVNIFFRNGPFVIFISLFPPHGSSLAVSDGVTMQFFPALFDSISGVLQRISGKDRFPSASDGLRHLLLIDFEPFSLLRIPASRACFHSNSSGIAAVLGLGHIFAPLIDVANATISPRLLAQISALQAQQRGRCLLLAIHFAKHMPTLLPNRSCMVTHDHINFTLFNPNSTPAFRPCCDPVPGHSDVEDPPCIHVAVCCQHGPGLLHILPNWTSALRPMQKNHPIPNHAAQSA